VVLHEDLANLFRHGMAPKDALCANVPSADHLNKENNAWRLTEDPGEAFCGTNVVVHIMVVEATVA